MPGKHIAYKSDQFLMLDNTRVIYGHIGKRCLTLCGGVKTIKPEDSTTLRQYICRLLA